MPDHLASAIGGLDVADLGPSTRKYCRDLLDRAGGLRNSLGPDHRGGPRRRQRRTAGQPAGACPEPAARAAGTGLDMRLTALTLTRYGNFDHERLVFDARPGRAEPAARAERRRQVGAARGILRPVVRHRRPNPDGLSLWLPGHAHPRRGDRPRTSEPFVFGRRKGRGNTLVDDEGVALDPASIARLLGRTDRSRLERLFALDTERLRQGESGPAGLRRRTWRRLDIRGRGRPRSASAAQEPRGDPGRAGADPTLVPAAFLPGAGPLRRSTQAGGSAACCGQISGRDSSTSSTRRNSVGRSRTALPIRRGRGDRAAGAGSPGDPLAGRPGCGGSVAAGQPRGAGARRGTLAPRLAEARVAIVVAGTTGSARTGSRRSRSPSSLDRSWSTIRCWGRSWRSNGSRRPAGAARKAMADLPAVVARTIALSEVIAVRLRELGLGVAGRAGRGGRPAAGGGQSCPPAYSDIRRAARGGPGRPRPNRRTDAGTRRDKVTATDSADADRRTRTWKPW